MWDLSRLSALILFFCAPVAALAASVSITEIMFDPEGSDTKREWVKIQNTGDTAIDLTRWKLVEGGVKHKIIGIDQSYVPPGALAVIAVDPDTFKSEYPGFVGNVFDSSFSLNNTGETVSLEDASSTNIVSMTYAPKQKVAKVTTSQSVTKKPRAKVGNEAPVFATSTSVAAVSAAGPVTSEASGGGSVAMWFVGLAALIVAGGVALFFLPKPAPKTGYTIIDISDKDK